MYANFNLYISGSDLKTFERFHEIYDRKTSRKILDLVESHVNELEQSTEVTAC